MSTIRMAQMIQEIEMNANPTTATSEPSVTKVDRDPRTAYEM